jgi:superoxide dismutase, Fe-Mn family
LFYFFLIGDIRMAIQLQSALKFNGGGHINHCIFWSNLCKNGGEPSGQLLQAINRDFGSLQGLQDRLNAIAIAIQGSGWGWLGYNKIDKRLELACCQNQDPLEPTTGSLNLK